MNDDQRLREETEKVLEATRRRYGFVPVVNQVLSERPDLFLPMTGLARAVLEGEGELDRKQRLTACRCSLGTPWTPERPAGRSWRR